MYIYIQSGGPNRERLYRAAAMILHHTFFPKNRVHFYLNPVRLTQTACALYRARKMPVAQCRLTSHIDPYKTV